MAKPKQKSNTLNRERPTAYTGHVCLRCGKSTANHCGPDGKNTLCFSCFDVYKNCNLQLYQSAIGRVSVLPKNGVLKVKDYEFLNERPGEKTLSLEHIMRNPVVLLLEKFEEPPVPMKGNSTAEGSALPPVSYVRVTTHADMQKNKKRLRTEPKPSPSVQRVSRSMEGGGNGDSGPATKKRRLSVNEAPVQTDGRNAPASDEMGKGQKDDVICVDDDGRNATVDGGVGPGAVVRKAGGITLNNGLVRLTNGNLLPDREGANGVRLIHSVKACFTSREGKRLVHRFKLEENTSFKAFAHGLSYIFGIKKDVDVFYIDDEGDEVSLTSDNEMLELFDIVRKCRISPIRIRVELRKR